DRNVAGRYPNVPVADGHRPGPGRRGFLPLSSAVDSLRPPRTVGGVCPRGGGEHRRDTGGCRDAQAAVPAAAGAAAARGAAAPRLSRTTPLLGGGLRWAWAGDTLGQLLPGAVQTATVAGFLGALIFYAAALAPLWARSRDAMRIALAIPYGAVVVGLFVACA